LGYLPIPTNNGIKAKQKVFILILGMKKNLFCAGFAIMGNASLFKSQNETIETPGMKGF